MPNVLLLGANGYIGFPLALSLVRSGVHHVYGVARQAEAARGLLANEIHPVIGSVSEDNIFLKSAIAEHDIDIVVNCTSAHHAEAKILATIIEASKEREEALKSQDPPALSPKLGYICTTGSSVYGSPSKRTNDRAPVGSALAKGTPVAIIRDGKIAQHEQLVLAASDVLDVAVIRPHIIYGRSSWAIGSWFKPVLDARDRKDGAAVQILAKKDTFPGVIHIDDVVSGYHAVIDAIEGRLGTWPVFEFVAEALPLASIVDAAKEAVGVEAETEFVGTQGQGLLDIIGGRMNSEASRAKTILGWTPKRMDFLLNIGMYLRAFEAHQEGKDIRTSV